MTRAAQRTGLVGAFAAGLVAWLAGSGRPRAAEVDPVALLWTAPPACPSSDTVHDQVEKTLGVSLKDLAPVAAVVTVAQGAGSWQAHMTLHSHGQRAERQFEAESCDALAAATVLIVALAAEGANEPPPGQSAARSGATPRTNRENPVVASQAPPVWTASSYVLHVGATFDDGTMPYSFAPGLEASAGRSWDASFWRLRLLGGASYFFTQTGGSGVNDTFLGDYWLLSFAARACATAVLRAWEIGPCVGGEFVYMHGDHVGRTSVGDSQYWLSPLGGLTTAFTIDSRVALFARIEVVFPTTLRTFMGAPNGLSLNAVYTIPPNAIRTVAGVELRFF